MASSALNASPEGSAAVGHPHSKSSLNIVDEVLSHMEPKTWLIRTLSKADDDLVAEHMRKSCAYRLHTSSYWHVFMHLTIALNGIQIGLDAETESTEHNIQEIWKLFDYIFTVIFAVEMIVALVALRLRYFCNPWNYLDFAVANIAVIDTFLLPLFVGGDAGEFSTFRVFRLLKLLRIAKMLKVVPELMEVLQGLFASVKAMVWVFLLLLLVLYTAGIFCKQIIGTFDAGYPAFSKQVMGDEVVAQFNNYLYFGSIARSMITLFNMIILAEWQEVLRPVLEHQPVMVLFFIFVVFLCCFGVLNVLVGVVVEHTMTAMREQSEEHKLQLQRGQVKLASTLADMVFTLDVNRDERISKEELEWPEHNEELNEVLGSLGLPQGYSLEELFAMLDADGNGYLSKLEFVRGIMRLIYCDRFQRDCLFRTSIGQVKQAIARSEQQFRQTLEQQLENTYNRFVGAVKQPHQRETCAPLNIDEITVQTVDRTLATEHSDWILQEHSQESTGDTSKVVDVCVVGSEQLNLSGPWNSLVSTETLCLEAATVSFLGGQSQTSSSSVCSRARNSKDVECAHRDASNGTEAFSDVGHPKRVTWNVLRKSLLHIHRTEDGFACDAQVADEMFCTFSSSHEIIGWMPVLHKRRWKTRL